MLLLWLSMVCMIPFEMSRLDGQIDAGSGKRPIVDRIIDTAQVGQSVTNCILRLAVFVILSDVFNLFLAHCTMQQYLDKADKCRDAAVYLLAKFLTRPDTSVSHLPAVIDRYLVTMETMDRKSDSTIHGQLTAENFVWDNVWYN